MFYIIIEDKSYMLVRNFCFFCCSKNVWNDIWKYIVKNYIVYIIDNVEKILLMILRNNLEKMCYVEGLLYIFVLNVDVFKKLCYILDFVLMIY